MHVSESSPEPLSDRLVLNVGCAPELDPVPRGDLVDWIAMDARLAESGGQRVLPRHQDRIGNVWHMTRSDNVKNIEAWSSLIEGTPLVRGGLFISSGSHLNVGSFQLREDDPLLTGNVNLKLQLEGRILRWQKLAELSIKPGSISKDDRGEWRFIMERRVPGLGLIIERKQVDLLTSSDHRRQWLAMALYHPGRRIVIVPDNFYEAYHRASHTAYSRAYISVDFSPASSWRQLSPEELGECRLVIFERIWLGNFSQAWESPSFALRDRVQRWVGNMREGEHQLSRADFDNRLNDLPEPDPAATRENVSRYLVEFLRLIDAHGTMPSRQGMDRLAALVPDHLDLLLEGLPAMAGRASHDAVIGAIAEAATEEQKNRIIASVPSHPDLAKVLFRRGWVPDARAELFELIGSSAPLPISALQAIAWFEDPKTYPRLLLELQRQRNETVYDTVRSLPGIGPQLDALVDRQMQQLRPVVHQVHQVADSLRLGLLHGRRESLEFACRVAAEIAPDRTDDFYALGLLLQRTISLTEMSPRDRSNPAGIIAWLQNHRADEFIFDPARRRFVLTNSIAAASVNVPASNPSRP